MIAARVLNTCVKQTEHKELTMISQEQRMKMQQKNKAYVRECHFFPLSASKMFSQINFAKVMLKLLQSRIFPHWKIHTPPAVC